MDGACEEEVELMAYTGKEKGKDKECKLKNKEKQRK